MGLQEHAEAALAEYWAAARKEDGNSKSMPHYIVNHMRDAVAEATSERDATIAKQSARIATLQSIGDLVWRYGVACEEVATMLEKRESWSGGLSELRAFNERVVEACQRRDAIIAGMNAILKGGD